MVLIGANNVGDFFAHGTNGQPDATNVTGATSLQISGGQFGLELLPGQNNQPSTYAAGGSGNASLRSACPG